MTAYSAWNRLFDETIARLRFKVGTKSLAIEPTLKLLQDSREDKRKAAAQAMAVTFKENIRQFTHITNTLAKDKEISDRWRGFADVADSRHLSNRVEPEVVDALVTAVRAAYPRLSHRYYALKAHWFGKKRLAHWDRNAPLPKVATRTITWTEAQATVLTAYGAFSTDMAAIAEKFFKNNWIDAPVRPGKAPGAFSHPTVPSAHPYVLLNYQGKPRDVMTLAHELGHGVHQVLAAPNGPLMAPTPLTLAETASVFGEMLTFRKLLAGITERKQRKAMLAAKVEDMINTVVRQIAFYTFEHKLHTERRKGELTSERINELWMSVQHESLGPAIDLRPGYETFWAYIPHFVHSPFYVYAYAFGDCLVNSLYSVYERSNQGFAERYLQMLAAGGTKHYSELLAPFGLDARDPAFWQGGLGVIEGMIDGAGAAGVTHAASCSSIPCRIATMAITGTNTSMMPAATPTVLNCAPAFMMKVPAPARAVSISQITSALAPNTTPQRRPRTIASATWFCRLASDIITALATGNTVMIATAVAVRFGPSPNHSTNSGISAIRGTAASATNSGPSSHRNTAETPARMPNRMPPAIAGNRPRSRTDVLASMCCR